MIKRKRTKGQTTIYKTLHRKLNIEQHKLNFVGSWFHTGVLGRSMLLTQLRGLLVSHRCFGEVRVAHATSWAPSFTPVFWWGPCCSLNFVGSWFHTMFWWGPCCLNFVGLWFHTGVLVRFMLLIILDFCVVFLLCLFSFCVLCAQCCQFLCVVHS
jgi:hypothetical protein